MGSRKPRETSNSGTAKLRAWALVLGKVALVLGAAAALVHAIKA